MKKAMFAVLAGLVAGSQFGCVFGVNLLGANILDFSKINSLQDILNLFGAG